MIYKIIRRQLRCYQHLKIIFKGPGPGSSLLCCSFIVGWDRRLSAENKISPKILITTLTPKGCPGIPVPTGLSVANRSSQHLEIWEGSAVGCVFLGPQAVSLWPQWAFLIQTMSFPSPVCCVGSHVPLLHSGNHFPLIILKFSNEKTEATPIFLHGFASKYDFHAFASVILIAAN